MYHKTIMGMIEIIPRMTQIAEIKEIHFQNLMRLFSKRFQFIKNILFNLLSII